MTSVLERTDLFRAVKARQMRAGVELVGVYVAIEVSPFPLGASFHGVMPGHPEGTASEHLRQRLTALNDLLRVLIVLGRICRCGQFGGTQRIPSSGRCPYTITPIIRFLQSLHD
jgi:hypothetical protein